jgi:hypothetical protein
MDVPMFPFIVLMGCFAQQKEVPVGDYGTGLLDHGLAPES